MTSLCNASIDQMSMVRMSCVRLKLFVSMLNNVIIFSCQFKFKNSNYTRLYYLNSYIGEFRVVDIGTINIKNSDLY